MMHWIYLIVAGIFEIGWPVGLKLAQSPGKAALGIMIAVVCMALSGYLLFMAQKVIPMGTAYVVWTGIGAVGAFMVGVLFYNDAASLLRIAGATLIVGGVVLMKLAS